MFANFSNICETVQSKENNMRTSWRTSPIPPLLVILVGIGAAVYLGIKTPFLLPLVLVPLAMAIVLLCELRNSRKNKLKR